jgi:hypothetical protein
MCVRGSSSFACVEFSIHCLFCGALQTVISLNVTFTAVPAIVRYVLSPERVQKIAGREETVLHNSRKRCIKASVD